MITDTFTCMVKASWRRKDETKGWIKTHY